MDKSKNFFYRNRNELLIFIIICVFHTLMCQLFSVLTQMTGFDEFAPIAGAAYFAGFDWTPIMQQSPYYGFGYSMLMAPVLKFVSDPAAAYHIMLLYNGVLFALSGVICYRLMKYYYKISSEKLAVFTAIAAAVFFNSLQYTNSIKNEPMLIFIAWVIIYLLTILFTKISDKKSNLKYTIILALVVVYSFLVHSRSIFYLGGIIVAFIGVLIYYKKSLFNFPVFISIVLVGYFLTDQWINYMLANLWSADTGVPIVNSTESVFGAFDRFFLLGDWNSLKALGLALSGKLYAIFALSGGVVCIALVTCFRILERKSQSFAVEKDNPEYNDLEISFNNMRTGVFFILSTFLAIWIIVSIGSLKTISYTFVDNPRIKWYIYIRYFSMFGGPLIMIVMAYLSKFRLKRKRLLATSFVGFMAVMIVSVFFLTPEMAGNPISGGELFNLVSFTWMQLDDIITPYTILIVGIIGTLVFLIVLLLIKKNRLVWVAIVSLALSIYIYSYTAVNIFGKTSQFIYNGVDQTYKTVESIEKASEDLPDKIYVATPNQSYYFPMQFLLKEYTLVPLEFTSASFMSGELHEGMVIITNYAIQLLSEDVDFNLCGTKLDDREYIYVTSDRLFNDFEDAGVHLKNWQEVSCGDQVVYYLPPGTKHLDFPMPFLSSVNNQSTDNLYLQSDGSANFLVYGPYIDLPKGDYQATFHLELVQSEADNIGFLDIADKAGAEEQAHLDLHKSDFSNGEYEAALPFTLLEDVDALETRVYTEEGVILKVTGISIDKLE